MWGFSVEAELIENSDRQDELCCYVSRVEDKSVAMQNGKHTPPPSYLERRVTKINVPRARLRVFDRYKVFYSSLFIRHAIFAFIIVSSALLTFFAID